MAVKKIVVALGMVLITVLILLLLFRFINTKTEPKAPELVKQMITSETCTPPCFFGHSLEGATAEQVFEILDMVPLTQEAALTFEDEGGQQVIRWQWSEDVADKLSSGDYILYGPEDENSIIFRGGRVWATHFAFAISLSELVDTFGNPIAVHPLRYTRFGSEVFAVIYYDPPGHFEAWTLCSNPELSANTEVKAYMYRVNWDADAYVSPIIPWGAHENGLPDCTIFQP